MMFTVVLTFDKNEDTLTPCICYVGRKPALFFNYKDAQFYADELLVHNPSCVYEVKELV